MPPRDSSTGGAAHGEWSTMSNTEYTTSTRSMPWFRLYTSLTHDPRFRRQPYHIRWAWIAVLSIAARCTKRGYLIIDGENMTPSDLADEAAITLQEATESLEWFRSRLLVVSYRGSLRVDGWERSQFDSDSSTKRVQKHRSSSESVKRSSGVTRNVSETPTDTDNREQIEKVKTLVQKPHKPRLSDGFDEWWDEQARKEGKGAARASYSRALTKTDKQTLIDSWRRSKAAYEREDRSRDKYPLPATWLNQERWADEYDEVKPQRAMRAPCTNPNCINGLIYDRDTDTATKCPDCRGE